MIHFETAIVRVYASGTEMRASYAAIRATFAHARPPVPLPRPQPAKPANVSQGESKRLTVIHNDSRPPDSPRPSATSCSGASPPERYVVFRGFGNYDVIEGRKLNDRPLTKEAAMQIESPPEPPEKSPPSIWEIQRVVAHHYNISRIDLLSARRTAVVVRPRQVAMYLAKTLTLRSLPEIGRRFGKKDHTTVLHAVRKIAALIETDQALAETIAECRAELAEGQQQ